MSIEPSDILFLAGPRNPGRDANAEAVAPLTELNNAMSPLTEFSSDTDGERDTHTDAVASSTAPDNAMSPLPELSSDSDNMASGDESTSTSTSGSESDTDMDGRDWPVIRLLARDWYKDQVLVLWAPWGNEGVAQFRSLSWESVENIRGKKLMPKLMASRAPALERYRVEHHHEVSYNVPEGSIKRYECLHLETISFNLLSRYAREIEIVKANCTTGWYEVRENRGDPTKLFWEHEFSSRRALLRYWSKRLGVDVYFWPDQQDDIGT